MIEIDRTESRYDADEAANQRGTGENLRFSETGNGRFGPQFAPHSVFRAQNPRPFFFLSEFTGKSTRLSWRRLHTGLCSVTLRHGRMALSQSGAE